jgi:hypothetical protein
MPPESWSRIISRQYFAAECAEIADNGQKNTTTNPQPPNSPDFLAFLCPFVSFVVKRFLRDLCALGGKWFLRCRFANILPSREERRRKRRTH